MAELRSTLTCVAAMLTLVAVVGLAAQAVGGLQDAQWRADGLPNWVTPGMLRAALVASLLVLVATQAPRIHRTLSRKQRTSFRT